MHEKEKLKEAKHFYAEMVGKQKDKDRERFKYNLGAFLASARSVLQYANEEAKQESGGQSWYDTRVSASAILKFLKDKRDIEIHREPVKPQVHYKAQITGNLVLSGSLSSIVVRDKNGNIKGQYFPEKRQPKLKKPKATAIVEVHYKFADWPGSEDVLTLCGMYLRELENVLREGIRKGFITG